MPANFIQHPGSYRDPAGFVFNKEGIIYRQVNKFFKEDFDHFIQSGCYEQLVKKGLLIPHQTIQGNITGTEDHYLTLQPENIELISYPYEWSFDMLKDAALLTLQLVKESLESGCIVKDATPYNVQWKNGKFIWIDSLSFEKYKEEPWIAYNQFCKSFLSPLLLMHHNKMHLQELLLAYPDGIPLHITSSLLPFKTRLSIHTYLHIHLHAKASLKNPVTEKNIKFPKQKLLNLILSLELLIKKLKAPVYQTTWSAYYKEAVLRDDYLEIKKSIVKDWISKSSAGTVADLGCNQGEFAMLAASLGIPVIAVDSDALSINNLYLFIKNTKAKYIQPLVADLANPTPAMGVNNEERASLLTRLKADIVLALALIHHLVIGKNISFDLIAKFFSECGQQLIIEFIPKEDEKIQLMLQHKKDIYQHYSERNFAEAFKKLFDLKERKEIGNSKRVLFLMTKK
jgi:ribosomal protein L11 methylase PrmA